MNIKNRDFTHLEVGDRVVRLMGGVIKTNLIVISHKDGILQCALDKSKEKEMTDDDYKRVASVIGKPITQEEIDDMKKDVPSWDFRDDTGCEVDKELGWDGIKTTGSYLIKE